jgi:UDP-N-acetylglucosamine 2-epimerase (non-hydrolysing)
MRPLIVFGTRPEAIKLVSVWRAFQQAGIEPMVVDTGQQADIGTQASAAVGLKADVSLELMQPRQTPQQFLSRCLQALQEKFGDAAGFDQVVVQGDTTSTLAGALFGFYRGRPVAHVEAGMRTGDLASPFPEEGHRRLVAQVTHWHFCPTRRERNTLLRENVPGSRIFVVGNTGIDALEQVCQASSDMRQARAEPLVLVTTHRRENLDARLEQILAAVQRLAIANPRVEFVFPVHPNPRVTEPAHGLLNGMKNVRLCAPLAFDEFARALARCRFAISDSGGIQEEAPHLGKPVVVVRDTTERAAAVEAGSAFLVGADGAAIVEVSQRLLDDDAFYRRAAVPRQLFGDGRAGERIVSILRGLGAREFVAPVGQAAAPAVQIVHAAAPAGQNGPRSLPRGSAGRAAAQ